MIDELILEALIGSTSFMWGIGAGIGASAVEERRVGGPISCINISFLQFYGPYPNYLGLFFKVSPGAHTFI